MMVRFSKSKVSGDRDVRVWAAVEEPVKSKDDSHFKDKGLKGLKIRDNYFKEADNRDDSGDDAVISDFEEIEDDSDLKKALGLEGKMNALMLAIKFCSRKIKMLQTTV